jgi:hypothetical protein
MRGRDNMIPLFEAQLRRENARYDEASQQMADMAAATLATEDLAVCLVEVR